MDNTKLKNAIEHHKAWADENQTSIIRYKEELAQVKARYDELVQKLEKEEAMLTHNLNMIILLLGEAH